MPQPNFAVEQHLPSKFIYQLGVYLQTCAHIELASCALITVLEGTSPNGSKWLNAFAANRKLSTSELIKRLHKAGGPAEEFGFSEDLFRLATWINNFVSNRHLAAHGAFFGSPSGFIRVDYFQNIGTRKTPHYEQTRTALTDDLVAEALKDANDIYLILLGMLEKIRPGLTTEVHRTILPIVEHPHLPSDG